MSLSAEPKAANFEKKQFGEILYERTAHEDLKFYDRASLDWLIGQAKTFFEQPKLTGTTNLRIYNPEDAPSALRNITVVEAVNDDMPFLLSSTLAALSDQGLEIRLVAHPIIQGTRDSQGRRINLTGESSESFIHIHISRIDDGHKRQILVDELTRIFEDVRLSVHDWASMHGRVKQVADEYRAMSAPLARDEVAEAIQFLDWLADDHFIFLGMRHYRFEEGEPPLFEPLSTMGLGVLSNPEIMVLRGDKQMVSLTSEVLEFLRDDHALLVTKANVKSRVHRHVHMDYIGVKLFDSKGQVAGELRIVGLFTASMYLLPVLTIPFLRHKANKILTAAHFDPESHSGKVRVQTVETFPRDELFQIDIPTLDHFVSEIAELSERPRLRILARVDRFDRFVSVLAYVSKERYNSLTSRKIGQYLVETYKGRLSAVYPFYPDGALMRAHFIIGRSDRGTPTVSQEQLEGDIAKILRTWPDMLREQLLLHSGVKATADTERYAEAFGAGYRDAYSAQAAVADLEVIHRLGPEHPYAIEVYRPEGEDATRVSLKVFSYGQPLPLSQRVPLLEHFGFTVVSEQTFDIGPFEEREGGPIIWLHDMALESHDRSFIDLQGPGKAICEALLAILSGKAQSDGYDALILTAGLKWRDVSILRSLSRYLQQIGFGFSQDYMAVSIASNAAIARKLVQLVHTRFDPEAGDTRQEQERLSSEIDVALREVKSLDDDRIIRRFLSVILAAVRSNIYQKNADGSFREAISFKLECQKIEGLTRPRPLYEISVYSPRVEGIHLRFGKVARGGLRWSDRPQDFRTEILGLVKAQQVKNAVIVPVGAKGGFVPKKLPNPVQRDAYMAEGIASYKLFVGSLLDLTDTISGKEIVPPKNTRRYDGDDPYLVVAADKGTATFSDIANGLAQDHGFWLDDAFASGGSAGYDHKKMGITARGAWEAVKRHFREVNIDIQSHPFSVVGVGDMSGDVFGNGMLLSQAIKLVAAFDHRDIFLDPTPDITKTLEERQRLFALPRSSWQDFDSRLISSGGGVYSRSAKSITLSKEIQHILGIEQDTITPAELMLAILKAPVDLLWFGGIGTYVRASTETDDQVGDRANDTIRILGSELRCKVVGEGANLGLTQRARVEAADNGVRLNTDAIDNSAGVNTSDVEVNIKIALAGPVQENELDLEGRNQLLISMTNDVAALVLRNNYQQTLALSLAERQGMSQIQIYQRFMHMLEQEGRLDRKVEYLPSDQVLDQRVVTGRGLTRPELAVLLAYAKLSLHDRLLNSDVPDDRYLHRELIRYFPQALSQRFPKAIEHHRLRREIVATSLANALINRAGPTIVAKLSEDTGADAGEIVRAFAAIRETYRLTELNNSVDALDNRIDGQVQLRLYGMIQDLLLRRLVWYLRNVDFSGGIEAVITRFKPGVDMLRSSLKQSPTPEVLERKKRLLEHDVPDDLAQEMASFPYLGAGPSFVLIMEKTDRPLEEVSSTFFATDEIFQFNRFMTDGREMPISNYYDRLAVDRTISSIALARRHLTALILMENRHLQGQDAVNEWRKRHEKEIERAQRALREIITSANGLTLAKLTVAAGIMSSIAKE